MSAVLPPPVSFDLDVAEGARLRDGYIVANGGRLTMAFIAFSICLQSLAPILRLYRYRGNDPFDWTLLTIVLVMFALALTAIAFPASWQSLLIRRQVGTVVRFDEFGITVELGATRRRRTKNIPLSNIRTVRRTPQAMFIVGRLQPLVTIPLRALPDGGEQIVSYFEERLVATRMLQRSSSRTTIVNTASP